MTPRDYIRRENELYNDKLDTTNKRGFFALQVVMSLSIVLFCFVMIAMNGNEGIYLPVVTGIVSVWLPQPSIPSYKNTPSGKNMIEIYEDAQESIKHKQAPVIEEIDMKHGDDNV